MLFGQTPVRDILSDEAFVRRLVAVEVALAQAEARLGIIPNTAAQQLAVRADSFQVDFAALAERTERDGFPITGLLAQLRTHVGDEVASFVHWGATTQDIMDTAWVLSFQAALEVIERDLEGTIHGLCALTEHHRDTLMAGRTHSQWALPTTFGLKVAGWLTPLLRHRERLAELKPRLFVIQFGGAAGTLAALGNQGLAVQRALAERLELGVALSPWHTQRDTFAELASWLSLVTGSLAKMAQDIILLAQSEVGEVRESDDPARGGSSTMPQKSNPIKSELIVAAARQNAQLLASVHQAMIQEHERATHGLQLEWLALPQMVGLTSSALDHAHQLSLNLSVDEARMRRNIEASNGLMLAEAASFLLAEAMPKSEAKRTVKRAALEALETNRALTYVLKKQAPSEVDWTTLTSERNYLGMNSTVIDQVLASAEEER